MPQPMKASLLTVVKAAAATKAATHRAGQGASLALARERQDRQGGCGQEDLGFAKAGEGAPKRQPRRIGQKHGPMPLAPFGRLSHTGVPWPRNGWFQTRGGQAQVLDLPRT
jgi:hypothetical protein